MVPIRFVPRCLLAAGLLLIPLFGCETAARQDEQRFHDRATRAPEETELVRLREIDPTFVIDARYATTNNFVGEVLYPSEELYLERDAAERLARVQSQLAERGMGLKIFDAFRPLSVQRRMWEIKPDPKYVANPQRGSRHNRGRAVDVTLIMLDTGEELEMPTEFDDFSERAAHSYNDLPLNVIVHRRILREAMEGEGFAPIDAEWWHYDALPWEDYPVLDVDPWADDEAAG